MDYSTKETVIYENDFTSPDLSACKIHGGLKAENGRLCTTSGAGATAFLTYTFPKEYGDCGYRAEVDVYGHKSGDHEGLLIGATGKDLAAEPSYFSGYTCTLMDDCATIAYFAVDGWGGAFSTGVGKLKEGGNYHLSVTVRHGILRYTVTSLKDGAYVQGYRFEPAKSDKDIYDAFAPTVGLRKSYNGACFKNFKITALCDVLPGALSDTVCKGDYTLTLELALDEETTLFFGMKDNENGYAVRFVKKDDRLTFFRVEKGEFNWIAERALPLQSGTYPLSVTSQNGVLSVRFDAYPFPVFEFPFADGDGAYATVGGSLTDAVCAPAAPKEAGETYTNPLNDNGADPDMLFYDGVYYLYVYANDGEDLFLVYTSTDLVHFTRQGYIFKWDEVYSNVQKATPWSPNVFYNESEKLFYLTFAAIPAGGNARTRTLYYATSTSPLGPFKHDGPLVPIHDGIREIDGHLYAFGDGKVYISLSRYDLKENVWLEEVELKDGRILAKPETAVRVIVPETAYENDGVNALCEGGSLFKHGEYYYLLYACGFYARHYGESYAVAKHPLGPYTRAVNNPILQYNTLLDGPGDALLIPSPDGSELFIVYHRHGIVGRCNPRNTCIDRVAFVKNPTGGPDLLVVDGPSTTPKKMPSADKN
ncbi:MAG: family 43 glycosylhydrolase [Clostridia bacterium]|nr:family 43 glycosylhydrolase [Clostridia bacterium]